MQRIELWASRMPLLWGAITGWVAVLFMVMGWLDSPFKWLFALVIWSEALVLSWRAANQGLILEDDRLVYQALFLRHEIRYDEIRALDVAAIAGISNYEFWLYLYDGHRVPRRISLQFFHRSGRQQFFDTLCARSPHAYLNHGAQIIRDHGFAWYP